MKNEQIIIMLDASILNLNDIANRSPTDLSIYNEIKQEITSLKALQDALKIESKG